ncbi:late competence protein ComER [Salibacterium halotolerans]|uniref:Competence protein ComER n=1 Tax=Salibacterium halotolerans TaxID=1884432 RepID=A0A1I5NEG5_9BACI|nr:late competence protein ComER [Salibacterium halotolerans]SFP20072.1 competence protein ComER [Salibacterium halotolerans]
MENIGLIGTGNMGGMLADVLLQQSSVPPENLYIYNRTNERNRDFQASYPLVHAAGSIKELLACTDLVFICVRPKQYGPLLNELKKYLTMEHILATITSPVLLEDLERLPARRVVRTVPTIANKTGTAPLLLTFGSHWTEKEKEVFRQWLTTFSDPVPVTDRTLRVSSDIISCGPAFMSYLLQCFIDAAAEETEIEYNDAEMLAEKMMTAYGRLLSEKHYSLPELCQKVNVPGGVTGEGLKVLSRFSGGMFEELIGRTHQKYEEDKEEMAVLFEEE